MYGVKLRLVGDGEQAMDRAHRIGQKKEVQVFRFCVENSIEEKVIEKAYKKLRLDALVIQQGRLTENTKGVNKEDLLSMVRYGAEMVFSSEVRNWTALSFVGPAKLVFSSGRYDCFLLMGLLSRLGTVVQVPVPTTGGRRSRELEPLATWPPGFVANWAWCCRLCDSHCCAQILLVNVAAGMVQLAGFVRSLSLL